MLTTIAKKFFSYLLKATILVLAFVFIYHQYLIKGNNLKEFQKAVNRLNHQQVTIIMSVVVALMLANWLVECLKWQHLTKKLVKISLWECIEGVFCGLTWAIFTPNRIGEYGGRVMFLPPRKRIHGVFAMAVGSFGQNVITNVLGAAALIWFCFTFLHLNGWLLAGITVLGIVFMTLFLVLYFNIKWLVRLLNSISFLRKYHRFFDIMGAYKFTDLVNIMFFCLTRFFIFSFQYYLVIHLLVPDIPFVDVILMVFIVFFIQSALPSLDLLDVPVRATASATLFAYVTHQQIAIIAAFTSIWLINLIIPAILGSLFIFNLKFFDRNV
ncbi:hypothetical protein FO440_04010 [Mucilaginibacter corticis]|uniref:Flippase-like domain-containing protein n=1 Tax=Mucilaginibacter corticis TaxID=2597670 RepID=A0A556MU97_9SPHI|nr:lysylphosphatidylglycerol synthase domain-containing protein [Mucilaginibacter corticis]TSJ43368.1 hypothetical protein FO440_04010 [Mucilaginibacter corticis]